MNKAEERAQYSGYATDPLNRAEYTANEVRDAFIDGYEQAEKDLELTWEDVSALRHIMARLRRQINNDFQVVNNEEFCKEVLKQFKAKKGS